MNWLPDLHNPFWFVWLGILIAAVALGLRDFKHFSLIRTFAISSVCFQQALRRRVLWITPLVILAIVVVTHLARPVDAQDDIRQATKFCLFATGLLLVMLIIILACTNLPKEIETRVIYTIATKPATRFEIILGKIIGFARVSAAILIIMGLFTFAFLEWRGRELRSAVRSRLESSAVDPVNRPTLEYYSTAGLLHAREYGSPKPDGLQVYSTMPSKGGKAWVAGSSQQEILVPFDNFAPELKAKRGESAPNPQTAAFLIALRLDYRLIDPSTTQPTTSPTTQIASQSSTTQPSTQPTTTAATQPIRRVGVGVSILNANRESVVTPKLTGTHDGIPLADPNQRTEVRVDQQAVELLQTAGDTIYLDITGLNNTYEFSADARGLKQPRAEIFIPELNKTLLPKGPPLYRGVPTQIYGQEITGARNAKGPVAVYQFRHIAVHPDAQGNCPFELRVGVERGSGNDSGDVTEADMTTPTSLVMTFYNRKTASQWSSDILSPESMRSMFFSVPQVAVEGGDFDVAIHCLTPGQRVGFKVPSSPAPISSPSHPSAWSPTTRPSASTSLKASSSCG